jgi:hypothetical protein
MEENIEYWQSLEQDRLEDIQCQENIGNPDRGLMNSLVAQLQEAQQKIIELNG